MTISELERLAVLETETRNSRQAAERTDRRLDKMEDDIAEIKEAVTSAIGGWRIIVAILALGATVGAILTSWIAFFRGGA